MQLICIYALYLIMTRRLPAETLSFGLLVPIYPAAVFFHTFFSRTLKSHRWVSLIGKSIGILTAGAILMILTGVFPWEWVMGVSQSFMENPMDAFKERFDELAVCIVSLLLWHTGWRHAWTKSDFPTIFSEFQIGFAVLFVGQFLVHGFNINTTYLQILICLFFILGLIAMILCRANEKASAALQSQPMQSYFVYAAAGIFLIFIMAALFMMIIRPETVETLLSALQTAGRWLRELFLKFVDFFMNLFSNEDNPFSRLEPSSGSMQLRGDGKFPPASAKVQDLWMTLLGLFWTGLILFIMFRMSLGFLDYLKNLKAPLQDIHYESIQGGFRRDLLIWIRRLWKKTKRAIQQSTHFLNRFLPLSRLFPGLFPDILPVKKIYTDLIQWSGRKGIKREKSHTPSEHEANLSQRAMKNAPHFITITFSYERYRYGGITPLPEENIVLEKAWKNAKRIRFVRAEKRRK